MYEISLVPDVKAELIRKLKIRNLVFLICIIVAASCGGVMAIFCSILGGQGLTLSAQDTEMQCRSEGPNQKVSKCDKKSFGTPIMKYDNKSELLTIQSQMASISALNESKVKFSRIFSVFNAVRPDMARGDSDTVQVSEFSANFDEGTLYFDGIGYSSNNIGYRALEAFKKSATLSYYDFGSYMRKDENGDFVEIPSYCIEEMTDERNITYGIYKKGSPGCEAPMVEDDKTTEKTEGDDTVETSGSDIAIEGEGANKETDTTGEQKIYIRRTYNDENDKNEYRNGNDRFAKGNIETVSGYYFESQCIQYDENGKYDENETRSTCPLLSSEIIVGESSYGRDDNGKMALSFSATLPISRDVLLSKNKHMLVITPTRQNVTDSYVEIEDMFTSSITVNDEDGEK